MKRHDNMQRERKQKTIDRRYRLRPRRALSCVGEKRLLEQALENLFEYRYENSFDRLCGVELLWLQGLPPYKVRITELCVLDPRFSSFEAWSVKIYANPAFLVVGLHEASVLQKITSCILLTYMLMIRLHKASSHRVCVYITSCVYIYINWIKKQVDIMVNPESISWIKTSRRWNIVSMRSGTLPIFSFIFMFALLGSFMLLLFSKFWQRKKWDM